LRNERKDQAKSPAQNAHFAVAFDAENRIASPFTPAEIRKTGRPDLVPNVPATTTDATAGILLAGGRSSRMGGGDKPLLRLGGVPLLARTIAVLRPQCDAMLISANGDPIRFSVFGLPVIADALPDFAGPLSGILAGLDFVAAYLPEVRYALSVATDTPFLPGDLLPRLHRAREMEGAEIARARSGDQIHFIVALWPVAIRDDLRRALVQDGVRKIEHFQERHRVAHAEWPAAPFDPFLNINTAADLAAAERLIARE
jgi:molybdenum cofactor guanylyltransferase